MNVILFPPPLDINDVVTARVVRVTVSIQQLQQLMQSCQRRHQINLHQCSLAASSAMRTVWYLPLISALRRLGIG